MAEAIIAPNNQQVRYRGRGGTVAKLNAATREEIPSSEFGLPAQRKYPEEDPSHAAKAKGRAKEMLKRGTISDAEYQKIVAKADAVEGR